MVLMEALRAVLLLSGGIDSPVAGWLMKQHGLDIIPIHFANYPFTEKEPEEKARKVAQLLGFSDLMVKDLGKEFARIAKLCNHRYYFVLSKRLMLREAEKTANKLGCKFIITGENLGQVSSQTLKNLTVIDKAVSMPVLRPLLTFEKQEIIDLAKKIGTYEISSGKEHCDALGPKHPATGVSEEKIIEEESKL